MNTLNNNFKYFHTTHWFSLLLHLFLLSFSNCFPDQTQNDTCGSVSLGCWSILGIPTSSSCSCSKTSHPSTPPTVIIFFFRWEGARLTWGCEEFRRLFSNQKKNQGWMICEGFIFLINSIRQVEKLSACCAGCSREQMTCFGGRDNPVVYFPPNRNLSSDSCADSESRKPWQ